MQTSPDRPPAQGIRRRSSADQGRASGKRFPEQDQDHRKDGAEHQQLHPCCTLLGTRHALASRTTQGSVSLVARAPQDIVGGGQDGAHADHFQLLALPLREPAGKFPISRSVFSWIFRSSASWRRRSSRTRSMRIRSSSRGTFAAGLACGRRDGLDPRRPEGGGGGMTGLDYRGPVIRCQIQTNRAIVPSITSGSVKARPLRSQ